MILVRLVYFDITPTSFRTEQSFSADGGATWELGASDSYGCRSLLAMGRRSAPRKSHMMCRVVVAFR